MQFRGSFADYKALAVRRALKRINSKKGGKGVAKSLYYIKDNITMKNRNNSVNKVRQIQTTERPLATSVPLPSQLPHNGSPDDTLPGILWTHSHI
jgi:hypothetical protein